MLQLIVRVFDMCQLLALASSWIFRRTLEAIFYNVLFILKYIILKTQLLVKQTFSLYMSIFRFSWLVDCSCFMCQRCLDNSHCLSDDIGKQDEMKGMYFFVQIRSEFRNSV